MKNSTENGLLTKREKIIGMEINVDKSQVIRVSRSNESLQINPSVTQGDLNEINGVGGRVFKFLEVKLHLLILIPIKQPKILRFILIFHQNGGKGTL